MVMLKRTTPDSLPTSGEHVTMTTHGEAVPRPRSTPTTAPATATSLSRRISSSYLSPLKYCLSLKFIVNLVQITLILSLCDVATAASCNQLDQDSLLSFSVNLYPPLNWSSSVDCCLWEGVTCDEVGASGYQRVIRLWLPSRGLSGFLSPSIANLSHLSQLNISHNRFSGFLPIQLFSLLKQLQILDLSYNRFTGELPQFDINSSAIEVVDLSSNLFQGILPSSFIHLLSDAAARGTLTSFNVSNNSLTGQIPVSGFCINGSSSSLRLLDFSYNQFNGSITLGLGNCFKLEVFKAGYNSLSGKIPSDIFGAVSLQELSLPANKLSGTIEDGIAGLANLKVLALYSNFLYGLIPNSIGKLSQLEHIFLHINNLTGILPPSLMNCTNLVTLNLRVNNFADDLSKFNFSMFTRLTTLDLGNNNFSGNLPKSLYACSSLTALRLANNQLRGQISSDILELRSLSFLSISTNNLGDFAGAINILQKLRNLSTLVLSKNFFEEPIPSNENAIRPDGFQKLQILALGGCNFTGQVPAWLVKLKKLEVLDLSVNQLTGPIPGWFSSLTQFFYIDLSSNKLTGEFPIDLTRLPSLTSQQASDKIEGTNLALPVFVAPNNATLQQYNQLSNLPPAIYLRNNSLDGFIPVEVGQLKLLHVLDLSLNNFSGNITDQLSNLINLEWLDLSSNKLSGQIPSSLKGLHFLSYFNVASNDLEGQIPTGGQFDTFSNASFEGNPLLCGAPVQRSCFEQQAKRTAHEGQNQKVIVAIIICSCFGAALIVSILTLLILSKRRIIPRGESDKNDLETNSINSSAGADTEVDRDASLVVMFPDKMNGIKDLTIADIFKATENFSQQNIIGCGGFGLVYRATLVNGTKLAIKRLSGDLGMMGREFEAEVEALSRAQHENLVSLKGYCLHGGFRLLIYTYMENGSLDYWLHEKTDGASELDWPTRLKIAKGASHGLAYMHQICEPHIVHRDIKSSNILLDENFEAHVADFGLARLILPYHTHVTTELVGTLGYIPPEYGQAWIATLRGDMYSFGVVMLELLTGKRPVEVTKPKMSRELVGWVQQMRNEGKQYQIFDPLLRGKGYEEQMLQVLEAACMCVSQNPVKRPTIQDVVNALKNVGSVHQNQNME